MSSLNQAKKRVNVKNITRVSMLSVLAFLLMYIQVPVAFIAPPFMKVDISDVPVLIGGFAMGPVMGVVICLVKNILHFFIHGSSTMGVGELSNFIVGSTFVVVTSSIYKNHKSYRSAIVGLSMGILSMTLIASLSNYFVVFPLYGKVMGMDAIIAMGAEVTTHIKDLFTMMIYAVVPFNIIKGLLASVVTLLVYKKVSPLLHDK